MALADGPRSTPRPRHYPPPPTPKMMRIAKVLADHPSHVRVLIPHLTVAVLWQQGEPPYDQDNPFVPLLRAIRL